MKKRVTIKSGQFFVLIVALLLCLAIIKMFYISLSPKVDGINLKQFAASRNEKQKDIYAARGNIYDYQGEALALSVKSYKLIAYLAPGRTTDPTKPKHVVDKETTALKLSEILGMDKDLILSYLNKDAYQVEFGTKGRDLTELVKEEIINTGLPGLDFIESSKRYYKMGDFASYIVGYAKNKKTAEDGTAKITGELGIESYFDDELSGEDGYLRYQSDAYGYQLPNVPSIEVDAIPGKDIYLTLDSNIQLITENAMSDIEKGGTFDFGFMTIVDAKTGAIVASATSPSFNPNDLNTIKSYLNPLVSNEYEPGSTMKIFSWASAIEEGKYNGSETYKSGSINVADVTIKDANEVGWGVIDYDTGFAYSSNVGAVKLALAIGGSTLKKHYLGFGFGKKTGIELSGEASGKIAFQYPSEIATASFGQGITITPIQMIQALTAVANKGIMLKPYIVSKMVDSKQNVTYEGKKTEIGRTMEAETAQKMLDLMYKMNYDGLSTIYRPKTVTLVAKTGTAQIPKPDGKGYLPGNNNTVISLAGIFPYENPRYILYSAIRKYSGNRKTFADAITDAVDRIAVYSGIVENNTNSKTINELENYVSQKTETVKTKLEKLNLTPIIIGSGEYVVKQYPPKGTKLVSDTKVYIITNNNKYMMPNVIGWSLNDIQTYCKLINLKLSYAGSGYVSEQSIKEGELIESGNELKIILKR